MQITKEMIKRLRVYLTGNIKLICNPFLAERNQKLSFNSDEGELEMNFLWNKSII